MSTKTEGITETPASDSEESSTMETLSPRDPKTRWQWLKGRIWDERSSKIDDIPENKAGRTRNRKQSLIVDPFLKRFSTRELHGVTPLNGTPISEQPELLQATFFDSINTRVNPKQTKWSFSSGVLNPKSTLVYIWNCVLAVAIFYHLWTIIFRIAFKDDSNLKENVAGFLVFDYTVDAIYFLDIFISSRISYLQNGILVRDGKKVAFMYLFTRGFCLDILALLPVDFLYIALGVTPALRLVRLIKVYKLFKVKTSVEAKSSSPALLRVSILVHFMFLLIHWNACFYFMISEFEGLGTNAWVYPDLNGSFTTLTRKYARSFYWSTLTLTAIGDLPSPETDLEYLYTICCYLCGVFMFATVVGNIGSIILNRNSNKLVFEQQRDEARNYMEERKVPKELQERVLLWYDYAYQRGRINGVDDLNSLNILPHKMKTELAIHIHLDTLKKVSFLQKCQPEFLHDLLLKMKLTIYTPGDLIIRRGEIAREMYLISDGIVQIIGESGDVLKELESGDFFGEIGILNLSGGQNRRIADVRSLGYTECFMLLREDVLAATRDYPEAQEILSAFGNERLNRTRQISNYREGLVTCSQDSNNRWPQFELQVLRESESSLAAHENEAFTKEGRLGMTMEGVERKVPQELKKAMKIKEKEISLLNDVIKELQREKGVDKRELQDAKSKQQQYRERLELLESENSKLRSDNKAKNKTITLYRTKIEELQRTRVQRDNEEEIVVTEVNECGGC